MKKANIVKNITACVLVLLLTCPFTAKAQEVFNVEWWEATQQVFRPEELDQMLAPIALYPDGLLAQVLSAATYPHSIEAANRLMQENPGLPSQALIDVARDTNWAPSVKAMLQFPDVLAMMDKYPDWTLKLGNAFLSQQRDVIDSVQRLRRMAYEQGRLATTREAVVRYDQQRYIFIEPANPQMVYVPVYDPQVVYGTWQYPQYPPQRYYYPSYSSSQTSGASSLVSFLAGVLLGNDSGWGGWNVDWQQRQANIRADRYNNFVNRYYTSPELFQVGSPNAGNIVYDTQFRKAAGYRDYTTAQRFATQQVSGLNSVAGSRLSATAPLATQTRSLAPVTKGANKSMESSRGQSNLQNSKASEVSQAAHAAKSEGLKGKDLAEKVHEAIDTRKEDKDALKVEKKAEAKVETKVEKKAEEKEKEKAPKEKVKEEKGSKEKGAKEKR